MYDTSSETIFQTIVFKGEKKTAIKERVEEKGEVERGIERERRKYLL